MAGRLNVKFAVAGKTAPVQTFVGQWLGAAVIFATTNNINSLEEIGKIYIENDPTKTTISAKYQFTEKDDGKTFVVESSSFPALCYPEGAGVEKGEIGIPHTFNIVTQEGGGFPAAVQVINEANEETPSELVPLENGVFGVNFTPKHLGKHSVFVTFQVTSKIAVPVGAWAPDPIHCIAYGPGLEGGEQFKPAEFTIESRNKLGDKIPVGGHNFNGVVVDPLGNEIPISVTDNGDGTYTATYNPYFPGDHVIKVQLNNDPIKDSPFVVPIADSSETANAHKSYAEGPGLEDNANNTSQRHPATFTIHSVDRDGNPKKDGGDLFDVFVEDPLFDLLPIEIKDNGDGTYTVEYQPKEPGTHHIDVVLRNKEMPLDWEHISNSPVDVVIKAGTDPSKCIAEGPGLKDGILDTFPAEFTIFAKDRDGNPIAEGGDPFQVAVVGPDGEPCPVAVTDNGNGTYTVVYQPDKDGPHTVHVTLDDQPIKDCPKTVHVKPGAWAKTTIIDSFSFIIRTKDKRGTEVKEGGQDVACKITAPTGNLIDVKTTDKGNGTYLVQYDLPPIEGKYVISCTVNNEDVSGSPFEQTVEHL